MSITSKFANTFDPSNSSHVVWLSSLFDFTEKLAMGRLDVDSILTKNPMGIIVKKEEMIDWVQIHFTVSMKYAQAVLKGKAFIPSKYPRESS
jgi:hypothetical protein